MRDERLYRQDWSTFEDYCEHRWAISRRRAYQLIDAADVAQVIEPEPLCTNVHKITNESHARELSPLLPPTTATPEERETAQETVREVYRETVERTGGKPTAAAIREVRQERSSRGYYPLDERRLRRGDDQATELVAGDSARRAGDGSSC